MSDKTPVYMIVQMEITDMERFLADYAGPSVSLHRRHGVEVLVATPEVNVLEGHYNKNFTAILKFPSAKAQSDWYEDPDYQSLKDARAETTNPTNSTLIVSPEFVPPQQ